MKGLQIQIKYKTLQFHGDKKAYRCECLWRAGRGPFLWALQVNRDGHAEPRGQGRAGKQHGKFGEHFIQMELRKYTKVYKRNKVGKVDCGQISTGQKSQAQLIVNAIRTIIAYNVIHRDTTMACLLINDGYINFQHVKCHLVNHINVLIY